MLSERLEAAFIAGEVEQAIAWDIAFHLTDWADDLNEIIRLYEQAQPLTDDEIRAIIYPILAHMPNHLAAAKKLSGMGPIDDIFALGVCEEDPEDEEDSEE